MALDKFQPYLFVSAGEQSNKYLTPVISPDGIASFQAQRAQDLTGLTIRIDPIQEGTGDPSPTNIRPISGRTGMTVTVCGVNVWDEDYALGIWNAVGVFSPNTSGYMSNKNHIPVKPSTKYKFVEAPHHSFYICYYTQDKTFIRRDTLPWTDTVSVITTPSDCYYICFTTFPQYGTTYNHDISVNYPATDVEYHPYVGQTYPVTWESIAGTVYGGTLDVVSGVLTVTHALYTITQFYGSRESNGFRTNIVLPNAAPISYPTLYCNMFRSAESYAQAIGNAVVPNSIGANVSGILLLNAYADGARITTYDALNALLPEDGCKIVYPIATPQTYQLTPTEVRTLAGYNQVYSDAGPVIDIKF